MTEAELTAMRAARDALRPFALKWNVRYRHFLAAEEAYSALSDAIDAAEHGRAEPVASQHHEYTPVTVGCSAPVDAAAVRDAERDADTTALATRLDEELWGIYDPNHNCQAWVPPDRQEATDMVLAAFRRAIADHPPTAEDALRQIVRDLGERVQHPLEQRGDEALADACNDIICAALRAIGDKP